jgi:ABC-type bacteriocin/lantibiotic exporter with double-glycine peptidase domain
MSTFLPDGWALLSHNERFRFIQVGLLYFFSSLLDLALVSLTIPFISALNNSGEPNSTIIQISRFLNFEKFYLENPTNSILLLLSLTLCVRFASKTIAVDIETKLKSKVASGLTSRLFEVYVTQNYNFHKQNDSTSLTNNLLNIRQINDFIYEPWLRIYYESMSFILIFSFLVFISPIATLIGVLFMALLLTGYQAIAGKRAVNLGATTLKSDKSTLETIKDSFSSLSEIRIYQKEGFFQNRFDRNIQVGIVSRNRSHQIQVMAPVVLEFSGLLISFMIIYFALQTELDGQKLIPIISSFVIALFRLIPSASSLQSSIHRIRYGKRQLEESLSHLSGNYASPRKQRLKAKTSQTFQYILFENVNFSYPGSTEDSVSCDYLKIEANAFYGVIGSSGSGKSTFVRLLSGLLLPNSGRITFLNSESLEIDVSGIEIGYVPQEVHLLNGSLAMNVAFGAEPGEIDLERVEQCLKDVKLHYLIDRFNADDSITVGEAGSMVSGGERQRIGLARALYSKPTLLILDEVTSSLDSQNEMALIDLITEMSSKLTIVLVTHRMEAIKNCNRVLKIFNGSVVATEQI